MEHSMLNMLGLLSTFINLVATGIMLIGFVKAIYGYLKFELSQTSIMEKQLTLQMVRCHLGSYLLFGLELMIVADIMDTMMERSIEELIYLASIIVIRTLMGYFLGKEIHELAEMQQEKI
jgi:uncharacterized membrane protein